VALEGLYASCDGLKLHQLYEAMDVLQRHIGKIEERVFFHTANLFNLVVDLIFYDTTTASFSSTRRMRTAKILRGCASSDTPRTGPGALRLWWLSRNTGRASVRSWVFPGNTSDFETIKKVRADLRGWKLGRALFVSDSGMNSRENRDELARACGKYLLATRMGSVSEVKEEVSQGGRFKVITENLHAKEVTVGDGELRRRYIVCYNPVRRKGNENTGAGCQRTGTRA